MKKFHIAMKRLMILSCFLLTLLQTAAAQQWEVEIEMEEHRSMKLNECISINDGDAMLGVGVTNDNFGEYANRNGLLVKVDSEGNSIVREFHLDGMELSYYCAQQLDNGNFITFGLCDDSSFFSDNRYQRYIRADVFNSEFNHLYGNVFETNVDGYDGILPGVYEVGNLKCQKNSAGNVLLLSTPFYFVPSPNGNGGVNYRRLRFYEFSETADTLRSFTQPIPEVNSTSCSNVFSMFPLHDTDTMVFFGAWGSHHIWTIDSDFNIHRGNNIYNATGSFSADFYGCDGHWIDNDRLIIDVEDSKGTGNDILYFHTLFVVDTALNIYGTLELPPLDSVSQSPLGVSTAYLNDSTIFAITYSQQRWNSNDVVQLNIFLIDKHLNLLGRKVVRQEDMIWFSRQPVPMGEDGVFLPIICETGCYHPGEYESHYLVWSLHRDDINITWDAVQETSINSQFAEPYPNPATYRINIPVGDIAPNESRIQIFDTKGVKYFDCIIDKSTNLISINTQNLEAGLYIYQVVSDDRILTKGKFVKEP